MPAARAHDEGQIPAPHRVPEQGRSRCECGRQAHAMADAVGELVAVRLPALGGFRRRAHGGRPGRRSRVSTRSRAAANACLARAS
jgi:hypothetical protein